MPQIRSYPEATALQDTDALVLDRIGTGTMYIESVNLNGLGDITALPDATLPLTGDELLPMVQGGTTVKATVDDIRGDAPASGAVFYDTIAALRAGTGTDALAYVEGYHVAGDNGGGFFHYDASDTTSPDDGAEIFVNADGARYVRQWSGWFNFLWAGAVGDGATDNAAAVNSFCYIARKASDAGRGFNLLAPPGHYKWNGALTGENWASGIKNLVVSGYGSEWTNINPGGSRSWPLAAQGTVNGSSATYKGFPSGAAMSVLINNTTVGALSFTTVTPADAGKWAVGDPILLTSLDLQWLGFPINTDHVEYHTVVSVDASTGIVTLREPIRYQHLTTYPDGGRTDLPCGKGRAWILSAPAFIVDPLNSPTHANIMVPWDVDQKYLGLKINPALVQADSFGVSAIGKRIEYIDCIVPGISPTIADTVIYRGCTFSQLSEPDKLVTRLILDECSASGVGFQSSSISHVEVIGGYYASFAVGCAKYITITNPNMDQIIFGGIYGPPRNCTISGGSIRSVQGLGVDFTENPARSIDGVSITYAAGVITVPSGVFIQDSYWGLVPGDQLNLCGVSTIWTGDAGTGVITACRESGSNMLFDISWPWADLTACPIVGHDGRLRIKRTPDLRVFGTTGCDIIRNAAEATRRGLRYSEFYKAQMVNFNTSAGSTSGAYGALTNFNVNVRQKSATATRSIVFTWQLWPDDTLDIAGVKNLVLTINLSLKGARALGLNGFAGLLSGDTVTFNGSPVTALPTGYTVVSGTVNYSHNITVPGTSATIPIVEFDMSTDGGLYGQTLIRNLDNTVNPVTNVTGLVPS